MIAGRGATSSFVCFPKRWMGGCAPGILPGDGMENILCGAGELGVSGGFFLSRKKIELFLSAKISQALKAAPAHTQWEQNRATIGRRVRLILDNPTGQHLLMLGAVAHRGWQVWVGAVAHSLLMGFLQIKNVQDHQWELEIPGSKTQGKTEGITICSHWDFLFNPSLKIPETDKIFRLVSVSKSQFKNFQRLRILCNLRWGWQMVRELSLSALCNFYGLW